MTTLRISHWVWVALLLSASVMLYHTSYRVQDMERQLARLEGQKRVERENIRVLEAEWAYLTAPSRLQRLSDKYLQLKPAAVAQLVSVHRLERALPPRDAISAESVAQAKSKQQLALAVARGVDAR